MIKSYEETTKRYQEICNIFGEKYLKQNVESPFDFIHIADKGVNSNIITSFRRYFDLPLDMMASFLNISNSTIYRWTRSNKILEKNISVKLFEITDLYLFGIEIFESKEMFFKWLELPNTALGGLEPLKLIEIPEGLAKVRNLLGRIEYGVYS